MCSIDGFEDHIQRTALTAVLLIGSRPVFAFTMSSPGSMVDRQFHQRRRKHDFRFPT